MSTPLIVETPAGFFRLTYPSGNGPSSREVIETARRFGRMPADLSAVTDVVADPCTPAGDRYDGDTRPDVTVNGVTYTGTLYYLARGYFIGADYAGDNGWCVGEGRGHYWTGQHLTRYTDARGFQPISDAGLRKLTGYLGDAVSGMLDDSDAVRDYWRRRFESTADYAIADARRALGVANGCLTWAREYGSTVELLDVPAMLPGGDV